MTEPLRASPGDTIATFGPKLRRLAKRRKKQVAGIFNGCQLQAYPNSTQRELAWQWTALEMSRSIVRRAG